MDKRGTPKLVVFNQSGHHIYYTGGSELSGYSRPDCADPMSLGSNSDEPGALAGCPVLDITEAVLHPAGFRWVFQGPMVKADLQPGQVERLGKIDPWFGEALAQASGEFATVLAVNAAHHGPAAGPLDFVSVAEYLSGWRQRGGNIGYIDGASNTIHWTHRTSWEPAPPDPADAKQTTLFPMEA